jgi:small redox-active disulfide protein 2
MKIEVLGSGCPNCKKLEKNVKKALEDKGMEAEIEKVTDIAKIMEHGVMSTPALVIDGKVASSGRVLSPAEIQKLMK